MSEVIDWQIFFVLLVAGFLGSLSVGPLKQNLLNLAESDPGPEPVRHSRSMRWAVETGVNLVVLAAAVMGGLFLSVHLKAVGVPLLESSLRGTAVPGLWETVATPIMAGLALGVIVSPLALYRPRELRIDFYRIAIWKRWLAGIFHGGIVEELVFRWFLLSVLVWLLSLVLGFTADSVPNEGFWVANTVTALVFGLMHLTGSAMVAPLTGVAILLTLGINMLLGLAYGYFFWRSGLEAAMLAHMSTHVALQPCTSLLLRFGDSVPNKALHPTRGRGAPHRG